MTANELRKKYIDFFIAKGHAEISGKSLVPENDPTVLFTTAGMHPLVPYILGEEHPAGSRLVNHQKCIRTGDIDEVGDPSHLTFFEMLGNWSLGDYFKEDAIRFSFEFLTRPEWLGIDVGLLSVTVFAGDDDVPRDEESAAIWKDLGIPPERIVYLSRKDNWWGPAGATGPCGPDTEIFVDTGIDSCGPGCTPGCGCGKYFEIWNDVFMQYKKTADGEYKKLERKCVDTGMGVERTAAMLQGKKSVYETELFAPLLAVIGSLSGTSYGKNESDDMSMRVIADHIRAATFILGDANNVTPSNLGQGYILRRLIRRAIRHGRKLDNSKSFLEQTCRVIIDMYADVYSEIKEKEQAIIEELNKEEDRFLQTLQKGEHEFEKLLPNLLKNPKKIMPGRVAFRLYDTFGFPLEITSELAAENGLTVDVEGFHKAYEKHQEASKKGADKSFKGGLSDHSEMTTSLHTATHLLHEALCRVLGEHVQQKGSNITAERLRFDFTHPDKMTQEEKQEVENIVNEQIRKDHKVSMQVMTVEAAKKAGAKALFSDRYDESVKVYSIGDFSTEVCGGPHVESTGNMGTFKIQKEQSSSAGVRRIRAVLAK